MTNRLLSGNLLELLLSFFLACRQMVAYLDYYTKTVGHILDGSGVPVVRVKLWLCFA